MILLGAWAVGLRDYASDRDAEFNFYAAAAAKSGDSELSRESEFRAQHPVVSKG
jgi:hypothetical protein